ncbi:MAG: hypothetical protein ACRDMZ_23790, partial [Solirubrobacteraceae bacterium]
MMVDSTVTAGNIAFGSSGGLIASPGYMTIASGAVNDQIIFSAGGGVTERMRLNTEGSLVFGPAVAVGWSAAAASGVLDTQLARSAAGFMRVSNALEAVAQIVSTVSTASQIVLGSGSGLATIYFGSAQDAQLARAGANALSTPGSLSVRGRDVPTATEGGLRIIRGSVNANGTIAGGTGFTVNRTGAGLYTITFTTPFVGDQSTVASSEFGAGAAPTFVHLNGSGTASLQSVRVVDAAGVLTDALFRFVAIGTM